MDHFTIPFAKPEQFNDAFLHAIKDRNLGKITTSVYDAAAKKFVLTFSKLGESKITYSVTPQDSSLLLTKKEEKIAFAHRPFRQEIAAKLTQVLQGLGAKQ